MVHRAAYGARMCLLSTIPIGQVHYAIPQVVSELITPIPCFFAAGYRDGRAPCHARKARPELTRLFKLDVTKGQEATRQGKTSMHGSSQLHPRRWGCRSATKRLGSRRLLLEKPGFTVLLIGMGRWLCLAETLLFEF